MEHRLVPDFIIRAAKGFTRERYNEGNIPTSFDRVHALVCFGDFESLYLLSTFFLKPWRKKTGKYLIVVTYSGMAGLFPDADEVWSLADQTLEPEILKQSKGFENTSSVVDVSSKNLRKYFDLIEPTVFDSYFKNGFREEFFTEFETELVRHLPDVPVPPANYLQAVQSLGTPRVVVVPTKSGRRHRAGSSEWFPIAEAFWKSLIDGLLAKRVGVLLWTSALTHDLSRWYAGQVPLLDDRRMLENLSRARSGVLLDVFSGFSRLCYISRSPFVSLTDRGVYASSRQYEVDDVSVSAAAQYVFMPSNMIDLGYINDVIEIVTAKATVVYEENLRTGTPPATESTDPVDFATVRQHRLRRMGRRLIRSPQRLFGLDF